ncbi:MAG: hypothetical protein ISN29_09595 [Gammaproteobacteria bacterium AqS3]|nr:hypothetical protein [Gammaproteobacteria bacterium AqS3]
MNTENGKFEKMQDELLASHSARISFLEHFRDHRQEGFGSYFADWGLDQKVEVKAPKEPWNADVFRTHPWDDSMEQDYGLFAPFTRDEMKSAPAWYSIHVKMVEAGTLQSDFFAYGTKAADKVGINRITKVLKENDSAEVEGCARDIMRHMGGIPKVRGRRSAEDCPTAKFYWNYRFAREISNELKSVDARTVYQALYNSSLWRKLVNTLEYQVTVLNNKRILAAFIAFIIEGRETGRIREGTQEKEISRAVALVSPLTSMRQLSMVETQEILALFNKVASS